MLHDSLLAFIVLKMELEKSSCVCFKRLSLWCSILAHSVVGKMGQSDRDIDKIGWLCTKFERRD